MDCVVSPLQYLEIDGSIRSLEVTYWLVSSCELSGRGRCGFACLFKWPSQKYQISVMQHGDQFSWHIESYTCAS